MAVATITAKGQITIPKYIRDILNLDMGDKIEFVISKENEAVIRPITKTIDEIYGVLHNQSRKAETLSDIENSIKRRMINKFR